MKCFPFAFAALALCLSASAQTGGKADVFSAAQIHDQLTKLDAKTAATGSAALTLADYGSHKLQISVRTTSGGAETHAHYNDVMIVEQGTATLITGGSVPDAKIAADGESMGTKVVGGTTRSISVGDIVTVNAGIPHQILVPAGTTYSAIVIKIRQ